MLCRYYIATYCAEMHVQSATLYTHNTHYNNVQDYTSAIVLHFISYNVYFSRMTQIYSTGVTSLVKWNTLSQPPFSVNISVYIISYTYSWQCIWAHIHGLCSNDPEASYVKSMFFFTFYVEIGIIFKFPAWSLTIQHRHATLLSTSSSSKCREKIRWRRLFINIGYEETKK